MSNKKLLFVINDLDFFFSHRLLLAKAAQSAAYQVHIAAPLSSKVSGLTKQGFYFHSIPLTRKGMNPFCEIKSIAALLRLYLTLKPNIIHHLTIKPIVYGGIAARFARVPAMVNAVTGLGYLFISQERSAKIIRFFSKLAFRFSFRHLNMRVIFQNPDDQQQFIQNRLLQSDRAILIKGSGVPLDEFQPLPEPEDATLTVLLPARLLWDKGIGEFVEAAKILRQTLKIRMVLVGKIDLGNPSGITQQQVDDWVAKGLIEYWGFQNDIREAYARCHIVCLPSYREGMPRALLEAAACTRAIVTTNVPGCRDIVIHRENGLLVEVKNAKALADGIETLANDSELRRGMGERGRQIVEADFSSQLVNKQTLAVYKGLLIV